MVNRALDRKPFKRRLHKMADRQDEFWKACAIPGSWKPYRRILPPPISHEEAANAPPVLIPYLTTVSSCLVFGSLFVDYKPPFTEILSWEYKSDGCVSDKMADLLEKGANADKEIVLKLCTIGYEGCEYWLNLIVESNSPDFKVGSVWNTGGCEWYEKYPCFDSCVEATIKVL
jgi:hypothetical protein